MKKRCLQRDFDIALNKTKRLPQLHSLRADVRFMNIAARQNRGVLPPVIRGCSVPSWARGEWK
ncbi:MAG: hypothetical protein WCK63_14450 [Betaproteobacteria bacterium]